MSSTTASPPVENWRQILGILAGWLVLPLAMLAIASGFIVGVSVFAIRWLAAAVMIGYQTGRRSKDA